MVVTIIWSWNARHQSLAQAVRWFHAPTAIAPSDAAWRLREAAGLSAVREETAMLNGFAWLVEFHAAPAHLNQTFSDYLIILDEMSQAPSPGPVADVARGVLQTVLHGSRSRLELLFPRSPEVFADFVASLEVVYAHHGPREAYARFNDHQFASLALGDYAKTYAEAAEQADFDVLGDYLIDQAFLHYFEMRYPDHDLSLPADRFVSMIASAPLELRYELAHDPGRYHDQSYYFTHLPLVLSNYGRGPLTMRYKAPMLLAYFRREGPRVLNEVDDIDLVGEFLQSLALLGDADTPLAAQLAQTLLASQNSDGTWGTQEELASEDAYEAMHPTWAAVTGLKAYWAARQGRARPARGVCSPSAACSAKGS